MNDPAAFIAAIIANPADDLPRLIFADWLDERGDPRGEFIRVQCELAKVKCSRSQGNDFPGRCTDTSWCRYCPRRGPMICAAMDLLATYRLLWTRDIPGPPPHVRAGHWTTFTRGFISSIFCTAENWLRHGDEIVKATPLERVTLTTMDWPGRPDSEWWFTNGHLQAHWPRIKFTLPESFRRPATLTYGDTTVPVESWEVHRYVDDTFAEFTPDAIRQSNDPAAKHLAE